LSAENAVPATKRAVTIRSAGKRARSKIAIRMGPGQRRRECSDGSFETAEREKARTALYPPLPPTLIPFDRQS